MRGRNEISVRSPFLVGPILVGLGLMNIYFPGTRPMQSSTWGWVLLGLGVMVLLLRSTTLFFRR